MTMLIVYIGLVCCINSAFSAITATPGIQRKSLGEGCNFQWSVTGPITNYSVYNQTLGFPGPLNKNTSYKLDSQSGVVTLSIWGIQLSDAGNYSLSVTIGTTVLKDASALLFVYGRIQSSVEQTFDGGRQLPSTEGDTVELTCSVVRTSLPVEYRPEIYYQWYLGAIGAHLQNISSGPARDSQSGASVHGYNIKDNGKTILIESAQFPDTQGFYCNGQEQWSPYHFSSPWFSFPLKYRPYISSRTPASKKFNALIGDSVSVSFSFEAFPAVISATNWSFINTAGHAQELPAGFSYSNSYSPYNLAFTFSSEAYYGSYSITISNTIGSTTETFQILRPGPPDAQSSVTENFVSSYLIVIGWNCMWSNGRPQQIFLQLKSMSNNSVIDTLYPAVSADCYNSSYETQFQNGIQPETDYEISVWSSNDFGSSDVVKLVLKTPKTFKLSVSPKSISLNGNQAIVNFGATEGKIAVLYVHCCLELTGICDYNTYYNVEDTVRQVKCNNIPMGNAYLFDLYAYGGNRQRSTNYYMYYLGIVKGVRVSRMDVIEPEAEANPNPLLIPVIVLGVLLGVAFSAFIGCLIAFLVSKRRQNMQPNNSQPVQAFQPKTETYTRAPQPTPERKNEAFEDDGTYESVERNSSEKNTYYTSLEGQRYS